MSKDDDIRILAEELTSSNSEEGEHTEAGEKTSGKETQDKQVQAGKKEKEGKGQIAEPKTEQGTTAQTPREKRLWRRAEKVETSQVKAGTATTVTPKQKLKTDPEMAAI